MKVRSGCTAQQCWADHVPICYFIDNIMISSSNLQTKLCELYLTCIVKLCL